MKNWAKENVFFVLFLSFIFLFFGVSLISQVEALPSFSLPSSIIQNEEKLNKITNLLNSWKLSDKNTTIIECNVLNFGAKGNGRTDDTNALRAAIQQCGKEDNNTKMQITQTTIIISVIEFPENHKFLTGALNITSNQIWWIGKNSKLLAYQSNDSYHYPLVESLPSFPISTSKNSNPRFQAFISSFNQSYFSILSSNNEKNVMNDSNEAVIDGQGRYWWKKYDDGELIYTRPRLIEFLYSDHFNISDLALENSPFWTLHLYSSDHISVHQLNIHNPVGAPNTDGIDIDSSQFVHINNVTIHTSDDHISIKSGENTEGFQYNRSSSNILIENSFFGVGGGLAIGSETSGGIHSVYFKNNEMKLSGNGLRFKTCPHYGYPVHHIYFDDLLFNDGGIAVYINENYECKSANTSIPSGGYHYIFVNHLSGDRVGEAGDMQCFESGCTNFVFNNITLNSFLGFRCANITGHSHNVSPSNCF